MTFHDDTNDNSPFESDYDPIVAEQFAKLDRVPVPDLDLSTRRVPVMQVAAPEARRFDPMYAMAVAAAVLVVAAASFVALRPSSDLDVDATNNSDGGEVSTDENGSAAVEDGDGGSLTVEVTPSSTAAAGSSDSTGAGDDQPADEATTGSVVEGSTPSTDPGAATQTDNSSTTTTSEPSTATTGGQETPPSTLDPDAVIRPPTTKLGPPLTTPDIPTTTFGSDGPADNRMVVQGMLTEVFTDCSAHYVLNESGDSEQVGPVSCDGGSYIVVDDTMIRTSSGYVPSDLYYDRHNPALRPGQRVVVSATAASQTPAALTLNCAQCGISLGG